MTLCRIWDRYVQENHTERHTGSQRSTITHSREDEHLIHMASMNPPISPTSRALSQEMESFRRQVSARTDRQPLQQNELSSRRPWHRLPFTLHHRQERLAWWVQTERRNSVTSRFQANLDSVYQHHDGRIHVCQHSVVSMFSACIRHRHASPSPGVMAWGGIEYTSRSRLLAFTELRSVAIIFLLR